MTLEAGQQVLHYRLIQKIGEGGMGVVWKAEDTKLHRHVALKVLPQSMAADPDRRARFEREARAVAALNHPNIVTLHSVEKSDGVHFITMELVEGRNLAQLLPRGGFPLNRLLEIAMPLADAVSRAHRAGITHRDLKPDNVMIDAEGRLRVLDFGLAKLQEPTESAEAAHLPTATAMTGEGKIVGTVAYMSPEQAEGKPVDHRSDIFSLGTILYEMTTGQRPFQGETSMSTIGAILKDEPSSVTEVNPSLPRHAGRILRRCLAKDPERRYQTATDLRNELEGLKGEIDSGVHDAETKVRVRHSPVPILIAAVLGVVVGAILATQLWTSEDVQPTRFSHRPVTFSTAWDMSGSWSPDGKFIAFDRMDSGNLDIYIKTIDEEHEVARIAEPGDQGVPRWSPDGRLLAYVSNDPGSPVFVISPDGGEPRELIATNLPALDGNVNEIMGDRPWSADGKTLLVSRSADASPFAVYRVDVDTGRSEKLTFPPPGSSDTYPTYSFDHERILFRRGASGSYGKMALLVLPAEGGEPELVLEDEDLERGIWRPDNRRIVFQLSDELGELDLVTGRIRQLASGSKRIEGVSVSKDDRVIYSDFWHDQFLYRVNVATGERERLTTHAGNNGTARVAPDGRTIAYVSNRTGTQEMWFHHLDGRPETRFTNDDSRYVTPDWSPDGKRLVFKSDRGGSERLFVASADGGGGMRLLVDQRVWGRMGVNVRGRIRWSPDGRSISYVVPGESGTELWTVEPTGDHARKRADGATEFDWYRGSRLGVVARPRGSETELSAVDLESGRERVLFVGALQEIDVAPDGSAVSFCHGRGHYSMGLAVLKLAPPSGPDDLPSAVGDPEYVVSTEGSWHVHNGGWSPDSKSLVYTHDQDYGDIYELEER
jgi:serine/threonine protein kinase